MFREAAVGTAADAASIDESEGVGIFCSSSDRSSSTIRCLREDLDDDASSLSSLRRFEEEEEAWRSPSRLPSSLRWLRLGELRSSLWRPWR